MADLKQTLQQGMALHQAGQLDAARPMYEAILKAKPRHPDALYLSGILELQAGRIALALERLQKAVKAAPKHAEATYSLGKGYNMAGRPADAAKALGKARSLNPANADVYIELGKAQMDLGQPETAVETLRGGLDKVPGHAGLLATLGNAYGQTGDHGKAIEAFRAALECHPGLSEALAGLGLTRFRLGDHEDALVCYDQVLEAAPDNMVVRANRAQALLALGRIEEGLADYAARWFTDTLKGKGRAFPQMPWAGEPLDEETLLVWGEQGLGDELLYFSLLPELTKREIKVVAECDPRLEGLLARGQETIGVVPRRDPPDERLKVADVQCAGGDLLTALGNWPGGVTRPETFIGADPARVAGYKDWLGGLGDGPKIGIAWASKAPSMGRFKTLPLEQWTPILQAAGDRAQFVTLQYGDVDRDIVAAHAASGVGIHTHPDLDRFNDIEGLAAMIEALDLVITTSNVTAHIAGALGKETWLVLGRVALWYWGTKGAETLFYPSITAFREKDTGSWDGVLAEVATALAKRLR